MRWLLSDPEDAVQHHLAQGEWYEAEELAAIKHWCPTQAVMVDVGANVGNHAVYFDKCCDSSRVIVFEPVKEAYTMLLANLALNYCHKTCVDHVGVALGSHKGTCEIACMYGHNLGATELRESTHGVIPMITGDMLLREQPIHFIKIDVEGWELEVLKGFEHTIQEQRPMLFMEIRSHNMPVFQDFMQVFNYEVIQSWQPIPIYSNLLVRVKS